jgi:hypothetical protein
VRAPAPNDDKNVRLPKIELNFEGIALIQQFGFGSA